MDIKSELSNLRAFKKRPTFKSSQELKLSSKKWKPSALETTVLKMHFQVNQDPTVDEKEAMIKNLDVEFHSQVKLIQLTRWFKNERERANGKHVKDVSTHIYRKFENGELEYLTQSFSEDNYPKLATMTDMAKQMNCSLSKIENWYKHNRRVLAKQGCLKLKTKKYFKRDELEYLTSLFNENSSPNRTQIAEIAGNLNCNTYQIKNWYSNRRKKFRILDKKNNFFSDFPMLENLNDDTSLSPHSPSDNKTSFGPESVSQFNNINTPQIQSSTFLSGAPTVQDCPKFHISNCSNLPEISPQIIALPEINPSKMAVINNWNNVFHTVHSSTQFSLNSLNNSQMMLQNNQFWSQGVHQLMYPNTLYTMHPTIMSSQATQLVTDETRQLPAASKQVWPNMYGPYQHRLQDAVLNGNLMNFTQQNRPLNIIMNPVQFVLIVDPNQQPIINNTL